MDDQTTERSEVEEGDVVRVVESLLGAANTNASRRERDIYRERADRVIAEITRLREERDEARGKMEWYCESCDTVSPYESVSGVNIARPECGDPCQQRQRYEIRRLRERLEEVDEEAEGLINRLVTALENAHGARSTKWTPEVGSSYEGLLDLYRDLRSRLEEKEAKRQKAVGARVQAEAALERLEEAVREAELELERGKRRGTLQARGISIDAALSYLRSALDSSHESDGAEGEEYEVTGPFFVRCPDCDGHGYTEGRRKSDARCGRCEGSGRLKRPAHGHDADTDEAGEGGRVEFTTTKVDELHPRPLRLG